MINNLICWFLFSFVIFTTPFITSSLQAQNVQFVYSVTGGPSWTWVEPISPTVTLARSSSFDIASVAGDPSSGEGLVFFSTAYSGGFAALNGSVSFFPASQQELFTGPLTNPTFKTGSFSGTDLIYNRAPATLVISEVAVPEPGTYATLAGGLALVALAAAKRKKQNVTSS